MTKKFMPLPTIRVSSDVKFIHPKVSHSVTKLEDPAIRAMIDLKRVKPLLISPNKRMYDARIEMQTEDHLHIVLVVDDNDKLVGFLSLQKILCEIPVKLTENERVRRKEILVQDVMRPIEDIIVFEYDQLKSAKVGDVIETLSKAEQHYALVLKHDDVIGGPVVRGVFLASLIGKQLGIDVTSEKPDQAKSLADLMRTFLSKY